MKSLLLLALTFLSLSLCAQQMVYTFYDEEQTILKEKYETLTGDESSLNGKYIKYHLNGNVATEGSFKNGYKSGLFKEYYESGKLQREINFDNGNKQGPVKVYNEQGILLQSAYFENNKLADSLNLFFDNGKKRTEGYFKNDNPEGL
uniref:toxin-antitoxin system YwqK family antitoxin n=1 Tax=Fulvivirga sp. TaxID=1931237 RepID=UPI004049A2E9